MGFVSLTNPEEKEILMSLNMIPSAKTKQTFPRPKNFPSFSQQKKHSQKKKKKKNPSLESAVMIFLRNEDLKER